MLVQLKERLQQLAAAYKPIYASKRSLLQSAAKSVAFDFEAFVTTFLDYNDAYLAARQAFIDIVAPNIDAQAVTNADKTLVEKTQVVLAAAIKYFDDNKQNLEAHKAANPSDADNINALFGVYNALKKDAETPSTYMADGIKNTYERYNDSPLQPDSDAAGDDYADPELNKKDSYAYQSFNELPLTDANGMNEDDVEQGNLGDCYALSTLAALARDKDTKELLLKNITKVKENLYEVTVYVKELDKQGNPLGRIAKKVRVDTDFPVEATDKLAYAKARNQELWVVILEKAYAKAMGGYDNIESGKGIEALAAFTGKAVKQLSIPPKKLEELDGFVVGLNVAIFQTREGADAKQLSWKLSNDRILFCHHAYSFQKIEVIRDTQMFTLRNPHGKDHIIVSKEEVLTYFNCIAKL